MGKAQWQSRDFWLSAALSLVLVPLTAILAEKLTIPAGGKPFRLGQLYDKRAEKVIVGAPLWDDAKLNTEKDVLDTCRSSNMKLVSSKKWKKVREGVTISVNFELTVILFPVPFGGSLTIILNVDTITEQSKVLLDYRVTTRCEMLKNHLLKDLSYKENLAKAKQIATHVVVGITYGAAANLVFRKNNVKKEFSIDIKSSSKMIEMLANGLKKQLTKEQKGDAAGVEVSYHGDFHLHQMPSTFDEALQVYHDMPNKLGANMENAVPTQIILLPLDFIPPPPGTKEAAYAKVLVNEVSEELAAIVLDSIEETQEIFRLANDVVIKPEAEYHTRIKDLVTSFRDAVDTYLSKMKTNLAPTLLKVKKGELPQSALSDIVQKKNKSPFAEKNVRKWINEKRAEAAALYADERIPNRCATAGCLTAVLHRGAKWVVVLILEVGKPTDAFVDILKQYVNSEAPAEYTYAGMPANMIWWEPHGEVAKKLSGLSFDMFNWMELEAFLAARGTPSNVHFATREKDLTSGVPRVHIDLYKDSRLHKSDYWIPSRPGIPTLKGDTTHDSFTVEWTRPVRGADSVKEYEVKLYRQWISNHSPACVGAFCLDKSFKTDASILTHTFDGLYAKQTYVVIVLVIGDIQEYTAMSRQSAPISMKDCPPGTKEENQQIDEGALKMTGYLYKCV